MPNIKIDNQDYDVDTLSDEAKAQLQSLQFVDAELALKGAIIPSDALLGGLSVHY